MGILDDLLGSYKTEKTPKYTYEERNPGLIHKLALLLGASPQPDRKYTFPTEGKNINTVLPTPSPTVRPTPTPSVDRYTLPVEVQNAIQAGFSDKYDESLRTLSHPMEFTNLPGEQERGINTGPNRGENPSFGYGADMDAENPNGTIDRGLFRINSRHFQPDEMERRKAKLQAAGITGWDDMLDPVKNALMARIIFDEQGWKGWYASPKDLRSR